MRCILSRCKSGQPLSPGCDDPVIWRGIGCRLGRALARPNICAHGQCWVSREGRSTQPTKSRGHMRNLITDVAGVLVGNADDARLASGTTAIIFAEPAVAGVDVRGGAPGTRETE